MSSARRWGGRAATVAALATVSAVATAACGDTSSRPAWVASHPDTSLLTFATTAPGVCAITVQYPDEAPAAVDYLAGVYVQVQKGPRPSGDPGTAVDRSGDWRVFRLAGGDLLLVTPSAAYDYRREEHC